jgi:hypothetical protein
MNEDLQRSTRDSIIINSPEDTEQPGEIETTTSTVLHQTRSASDCNICHSKSCPDIHQGLNSQMRIPLRKSNSAGVQNLLRPAIRDHEGFKIPNTPTLNQRTKLDLSVLDLQNINNQILVIKHSNDRSVETYVHLKKLIERRAKILKMMQNKCIPMYLYFAVIFDSKKFFF